VREREPIDDPYRTLGLEPSASMAEVKRAYRRLAKAFHPDSAGEAALPRFLAIHEAYDRLNTGRAFAGAGPTRPAGPEPWRADPERAQAARERARAGRRARASASGASWSSGAATGAAGTPGGRSGSAGASRRPGANGPARAGSSAGAPDSAGASGSAGAPGAGGRTTSGTSGTSGGGGPGGSTPGSRGSTGTAAGGASGRRRATRKATLGSTSYDEARDPADATWSGASWYGPSTGEYWIINPREYADPRKHGPDYQSRARRPSIDPDDEWAPPEADGQPTTPEDGAPPTDAQPDWTDPIGAPSGGPAPEPAGAGASAGQPDELRWADGWARTAAGPAMAGSLDDAPAGPTPRRPAGETTRDWLGGSTDDPIRRLGIALVAWPPIGLAAAAAIGEATGCASYAAACSGTDSLLPWLAQAGILGVLLLFPPLARLLAGGTIAIVLAILPVTGFLLAVGASGTPQAGSALLVLLGGAWLFGVVWSLMIGRRRAIESGRLGARDGP
jgi:hypothetical protein